MPPLVLAPFEIPIEGLTPQEAACGALAPNTVKWHVEIQGRMTRFYRTGVKMRPVPQCDKRAIGPWSMQSRMRLLRLVNRIDYTKLGPSLFVTLTYPDHCQRKDYPARSQDRAVFLRYVEKHLGRHVACLWRIEWEQRKSGAYTGCLAPHFHLMLFNVPHLAWQDVRTWWRATIKAGPGPLVTEVTRIYNEDGACRYLAKYVAKYRSLDIATYHNSPYKFGRHWGLCRPELVPMCPVVVARELTEDERKHVQEFARTKWPMYDENGAGGFTLLDARKADAFARIFKRGGSIGG